MPEHREIMITQNIKVDLKEGDHLTIIPFFSEKADEIKAVALTKEDIKNVINYIETGAICFSILLGFTGFVIGILLGAIYL